MKSKLYCQTDQYGSHSILTILTSDETIESLTDFINTKIVRPGRSPHFGCTPHHAPSKFQPWKLCFISILWVEISYRFCTILTRLLRTLPSLETQRFLLDTTSALLAKDLPDFWKAHARHGQRPACWVPVDLLLQLSGILTCGIAPTV
jgi:hypothetical protein